MDKKIFELRAELASNIARAKKKRDNVQDAVNFLQPGEMTVTIELIDDLLNGGELLYNHMLEVIESDADKINISENRSKYIKERLASVKNNIARAKQMLFEALEVESENPLSIKAYEIKGDWVSVSDNWVESINKSFEDQLHLRKEEALEIIDNIQENIKALNDLVVGNPHFGVGFTSSEDDRPCLMYVREDGSFHVNVESIEFL